MSKLLKWEEFTDNVSNWAKDRGIYDYSSPNAQLMKTFEELGELAGSLIKGDHKNMKDGVGDSVVCLINYAYMTNQADLLDWENIENTFKFTRKSPMEAISWANIEVGYLVVSPEPIFLLKAIANLLEFCYIMSLSFMECCTEAWNEVKDRKGKMVAGGAFVKDE